MVRSSSSSLSSIGDRSSRFESVSDDAHTILESDGAVRWCFFKFLLLGVEVLGP